MNPPLQVLLLLLPTMTLHIAFAQLPLVDKGAPVCGECPIPEEGAPIKTKPVCGTDGRTYDGRCQLDRARCQGHPVEVAHRGKCPETVRCLAQRAQAQMQSRKYAALGIFVPECKEDGRYLEVQCHGSTGYCWCVDESGKPIPGSSVRYKKPNCLQQGCSNTERSTFNKNLIDIFKSEWSRIPSHSVGVPAHSPDPLMDTEQKRVIQWKFTQLDTNGDQTLRRREVRDLRRLVKKIVRPRPCAKTFIKYCDLDQDKVISRTEWSACLGVDMNNEQLDAPDIHSTSSPPVINRPKVTGVTPLDDEEEEEEVDEELEEEPIEEQHHPHGGWRLTPMGSSRGQDSSKEEDIHDCGSAKRMALENVRQAPGGGHYVPECSADGSLYLEAQCHQETCWCVNPKTGKPIRGTVTKSVKPDCQFSPAKSTSFKGCSVKKKKKFVDEYQAYLTQEYSQAGKNMSQSMEQGQEQLSRWKHSQLDINKNQILDRKEWKLFRKDWKAFRKVSKRRKKLRKCWRNFPRFCDKNTDDRVTVDEWLTCTATSQETLPRSPATAVNDKPLQKDTPKRRGPNPFDTILKSE